jgi:glycosyltransferase involved in cell wall biosynthesis
MKFTFSIGIPTYNQAQYLDASILSAINQSIKPKEIVVYDDCSTDETAQVLESLLLQIKELKVFRQSQNKGIASNKEACLKACTGDYIILLDSDDILKSNYAETLITLMEQFPTAGYAHGNVQQIDEFGNNTILRQLFRKEIYISADEELKRQIEGMKVAANIILYRKEALVAIDYFNCKANFAEDWFMLCQLAAAGYGNVFSTKVLSSYRVWTDSGQLRPKRKLDEINGTRLVYDEVLTPAFKERKWDLSLIHKAKTKKAINHSSCLSLNYFSIEEKKELKEGLLKLSDNRLAKVFFYLQEHQTNIILKYYTTLRMDIRKNLKKLFIKVFNKKNNS